MDLIRSLLRPRGDIAIPQYSADDRVDLLIKALFYMFRRVDLSAPYNQKVHEVSVDGLSEQNMENLDKMYNKDQFIATIYHNKHRILSDWPKNKFRSLLILSHIPQMDELPEFPKPGYRFTILHADSSDDEYIKTLASSDIYIEHNLPLQVRRKIAQTLVLKHPSRDLATRAALIAEFVELIAVEVQVARLYKVAVDNDRRSPLSTPTNSPPRSPQRSPQLQAWTSSNTSNPSGGHASPPRTLSKSPSRSQMRPHGSPTRITEDRPSRLRLAPSLGNMRENASSPSPTPRSPPRSPTHRASSPTIHRSESPGSRPASPTKPPLRLKLSKTNLKDGPDLSISAQPRKILLDQSRLAVEARLQREKEMLDDE